MGLIVSFCPRFSNNVRSCFFCDSKVGECHTKMCDQTRARRIHEHRCSQTVQCTVLNPIFYPFSNC